MLLLLLIRMMTTGMLLRGADPRDMLIFVQNTEDKTNWPAMDLLTYKFLIMKLNTPEFA